MPPLMRRLTSPSAKNAHWPSSRYSREQIVLTRLNLEWNAVRVLASRSETQSGVIPLASGLHAHACFLPGNSSLSGYIAPVSNCGYAAVIGICGVDRSWRPTTHARNISTAILRPNSYNCNRSWRWNLRARKLGSLCKPEPEEG